LTTFLDNLGSRGKGQRGRTVKAITPIGALIKRKKIGIGRTRLGTPTRTTNDYSKKK